MIDRVNMKWLSAFLMFLLILPILQPFNLTTRTTPTQYLYPPYLGMGSGPTPPQPASPEYLIISSNDSWVQSFADWKTKKGVPTVCANVTWISGNVAGTDTAEKIWNHINTVYTTSPSLTWVLLVGDNSTLPPRYVYSPETYEWPGLSPTTKPTDFYYACMDDNDWDDDNDGRWGECNNLNVGGPAYDEVSDWDPDLYVGRIPFSDETNVTSILTQAVTYARNPTSYATTGWNNFLLAGAYSNYDEEINAWLDVSYPDWTDEAELCDRIIDDLTPSHYLTDAYYEDHWTFWNYTPTNLYTFITDTSVSTGVNSISPTLINYAGHGSPVDIQRKYQPYGFPYGGRNYLSSPGFAHNVSGIAIGDADNDNWGYNDIIATTGPQNSGTNGTVWFYNGSSPGASPVLIWDLWRNPPPGCSGPTWATCVDTGDVWNNGTLAVVVGTWGGDIIIFTFWNRVKWTAFVVNTEYGDPVLCIETGNADNANGPPGQPGQFVINMAQTDIAWGHLSGFVVEATVWGGAPPTVMLATIRVMASGVYSIDVGNPNDDGWNEITYGTALGNVGMSQWNPAGGVMTQFTVENNVGGTVYGLDTGNAGNDGSNKIVIGVDNGAIYMYEAGSAAYPGFSGGDDSGTRKTIAAPGSNGGLVRCLRVGYVDENDAPGTTQVDVYSIIVGLPLGGLWKYHADNTTGYVDDYPIETFGLAGFSPGVTALDVGELSYTTALTEVGANVEIATGTNASLVGLCDVNWYEWPWAQWSNMINSIQADASTAAIPSFVYTDSCLTGAFDYTQESLAEAYLRNDAIGYIGCMRVSWYYYGPMAHSFSWAGSRWQAYNFWDLFFSGTTDYKPGKTLFESKRLYNSTYWPIYVGAGGIQYWEKWHRKNLMTQALFGDPEIDIFTNNPSSLTVDFPLAVTAARVPHNQNTLIRVRNGTTPVANATVCLWDRSGSFYHVANTNASGYVVVNITATVGTNLEVTVTKHNYQPDESLLQVDYWIDITGTTLVYNSFTQTLAISGVIATCENTAHAALDSTEATVYAYTVYQGATPTSITGNLAYSGGTWQNTGVTVSTLTPGTYYIRITFADSDASGWTGFLSFTITIPSIIDLLFGNLFLILIIVIVVILIIVCIIYLRRRKKK